MNQIRPVQINRKKKNIVAVGATAPLWKFYQLNLCTIDCLFVKSLLILSSLHWTATHFEIPTHMPEYY